MLLSTLLLPAFVLGAQFCELPNDDNPGMNVALFSNPAATAAYPVADLNTVWSKSWSNIQKIAGVQLTSNFPVNNMKVKVDDTTVSPPFKIIPGAEFNWANEEAFNLVMTGFLASPNGGDYRITFGADLTNVAKLEIANLKAISCCANVDGPHDVSTLFKRDATDFPKSITYGRAGVNAPAQGDQSMTFLLPAGSYVSIKAAYVHSLFRPAGTTNPAYFSFKIERIDRNSNQFVDDSGSVFNALQSLKNQCLKTLTTWGSSTGQEIVTTGKSAFVRTTTVLETLTRIGEPNTFITKDATTTYAIVYVTNTATGPAVEVSSLSSSSSPAVEVSSSSSSSSSPAVEVSSSSSSSSSSPAVEVSSSSSSSSSPAVEVSSSSSSSSSPAVEVSSSSSSSSSSPAVEVSSSSSSSSSPAVEVSSSSSSSPAVEVSSSSAASGELSTTTVTGTVTGVTTVTESSTTYVVTTVISTVSGELSTSTVTGSVPGATTVTESSTTYVVTTEVPTASGELSTSTVTGSVSGVTTVTESNTTYVVTTECPEGEGIETVTNVLTTIVTITSCDDHKCQETTVPATWGPVTSTLQGGIVTVYTTWCPETGAETGPLTTTITITSCSENKCIETPVPATWGPATSTLAGGEVTVYTTWCPVTEAPSTTVYETIVCTEDVCKTSTVTGILPPGKVPGQTPGQTTLETVGTSATGSVQSAAPAVSTAFNGAIKVGSSLLALVALPLAYLL